MVRIKFALEIIKPTYNRVDDPAGFNQQGAPRINLSRFQRVYST